MTSTQVELFLRRLSRSKLLDSDQLTRAAAIASREANAERAAVRLVSENLLTRWQARQLLSGEKTRFYLGHYRLLKELGRGSMGTVYRAVHPTMSRIVALKVMSQEFLKDRRAVARFQREIRIAAALDHPQIVRALDAGCEEGVYYLVMEHVEGKDLRYWIKASGPLPVPWSCECIRQAAQGLQHAHERGVAHRDIKPSNLLLAGKSLDERPQIKIVDFGLARVGEDLAGEMKLTRVGRTVGTWAYMAPEQTLDSNRADIRSDIFSLGCTLFQMVTGELPFKGGSDLETLMQRLKVEAPRLKSLRPEIDPRLDEIVAKMLARDPNQRFQTPAELEETLAASGLPAQTTARAARMRPARDTDDDSSERVFGNTDPEFDQFLQTFSEMSVRDSSAKSPRSDRPCSGIPWDRLAWPALVAALGTLIAFAAWAFLT